jgi:hypothetical protein
MESGMSKLIVAILMLSFSSFAKVNLKINLSTNIEQKDKTTVEKVREFEVITNLDKIQIIKLNINEEMEVKVSKVIPEGFTVENNAHDFFIDTKIYKISKNSRELISAPKVLTVPGKKAMIETVEEKNGKTITTRMLILPKEI